MGSNDLSKLLRKGLALVRADPGSNLCPSHRLAIYRDLGRVDSLTGPVHPIRGRLGMLVTRRVLPVWQSVTPIWEEIPAGAPDDNLLPQRLLGLCQDLLAGAIDLQAATAQAADLWYVVGNIGEELTAVRPDLPRRAYYVCDAALRALYEALGTEFVGHLTNPEAYTDDELPDLARDCASSAMIAYAGGAHTGPVDLERRRAFWEWWLTEAVPAARQQGTCDEEYSGLQ